jgi:hypothetical protein
MYSSDDWPEVDFFDDEEQEEFEREYGSFDPDAEANADWRDDDPPADYGGEYEDEDDDDPPDDCGAGDDDEDFD